MLFGSLMLAVPSLPVGRVVVPKLPPVIHVVPPSVVTQGTTYT
jgi:hypothetical protein